VRPHGKTKLGFFPLPTTEAERLRNCLTFAPEFSAVDPCVDDGVAFTCLLSGPMVIDTALIWMPIAPNKPEFWESKHCRRTRWMCAARRNQSLFSISILNPAGRFVRGAVRPGKYRGSSHRHVCRGCFWTATASTLR
jgi:hypothetical protein